MLSLSLSLLSFDRLIANHPGLQMNQGATFGLGRYQKCIFVLCGFG